MTQYHDLLNKVMTEGVDKGDRTGTGTRSIFGHQMKFDLREGFPAVTTKQVYWKTALKEIIWMLNGRRDLQGLLKQNVHIWSDWPYKKFKDLNPESELSMWDFEQEILKCPLFNSAWGDLGPIYGSQWRSWPDRNGGGRIDQVEIALDLIKNSPNSRRIIIEGWNVAALDEMALPPCHKTYQFYVVDMTLQERVGYANKAYGESEEGLCWSDTVPHDAYDSEEKISLLLDAEGVPSQRLSMCMYQRSVDIMAGLPFNLVNGAFMLHMFAHLSGMEAGELTWWGADCHIYSNHFDQVEEQLSREEYPLPTLEMNCEGVTTIEGFSHEQFNLVGYEHHPAIKVEISV